MRRSGRLQMGPAKAGGGERSRRQGHLCEHWDWRV